MKASKSWIGNQKFYETFYDITFFNSDTYEHSKKMDVSKHFRVANMFFRLHEDVIKHEKTLYSLLDIVATIGGVHFVYK